MVAIGEVGLAGEVRRVPDVSKRLAEAARLGVTTAVIPQGQDKPKSSGITLIEAPTMAYALSVLGLRKKKGE
jgi:DNA repair protein RadA/Sms